MFSFFGQAYRAAVILVYLHTLISALVSTGARGSHQLPPEGPAGQADVLNTAPLGECCFTTQCDTLSLTPALPLSSDSCNHLQATLNKAAADEFLYY